MASADERSIPMRGTSTHEPWYVALPGGQASSEVWGAWQPGFPQLASKMFFVSKQSARNGRGSVPGKNEVRKSNFSGAEFSSTSGAPSNALSPSAPASFGALISTV